ncbi:signal peptidase II [Novosphingopyxis baekryungensis]|uniref:signal peptidase II n=1 Tax=Novosphingopyxis baekryungensis TaxID=279369 RepID=UPI0003B72822|nr:signal peptidase II [Novosphingopyxis baekryungensis]
MTLASAKKAALAIIPATFVLDQLSKAATHGLVGAGNVMVVFPGFNLVAFTNSGVAFGLAGDAAPVILIAIGIILSGLLGAWLFRTQSTAHSVGLGLAIGGALSNVADRLMFGAVRDYIDLFWGTHHWPAFNLADIAIVIGLSLLVLVGEEQPETGEAKHI